LAGCAGEHRVEQLNDGRVLKFGGLGQAGEYADVFGSGRTARAHGGFPEYDEGGRSARSARFLVGGPRSMQRR